jgi:hypothetical protein
MRSRNDFDEIIRPDENDIFIADTDPFDLGDRSSIAIISGNHERIELRISGVARISSDALTGRTFVGRLPRAEALG